MAEKTMAHDLPPVTMAKKQLLARPIPAVRVAAEWALFAAFALVASLAFDFTAAFFHLPCSPGSVVLRCVRLTVVEATERISLRKGMLWCTAPQVAAAALALLLPRRRRGARRALAYAAIAAAAASHFMYAGAIRVVLNADPWYLLFRISGSVVILVLAAGDLLSFLVLLLGSED